MNVARAAEEHDIEEAQMKTAKVPTARVGLPKRSETSSLQMKFQLGSQQMTLWYRTASALLGEKDSFQRLRRIDSRMDL